MILDASSTLAISTTIFEWNAEELFCRQKLVNPRVEQGNAQRKNSPVDCFGACVRGGERRSEPSDSRHLHQSCSGQCSLQVRIYNFGALAQLGAHHTGSVGVRGSSPLCSTKTETAPLGAVSVLIVYGDLNPRGSER